MKRAFFNIKIDVLTSEEVLDICKKSLHSVDVFTIFFMNAHCFNIAQKNEDYRRVINESSLLLNDGIGIQLASFLTDIKFSENLNGTDLIPKILTIAAEQHAGVFFLGSKHHIAELASIEAKKNNPDLIISGYHSGYFEVNEEEKVITKINESGAKILILGMGVPRQELWSDRNKELLNHVKIIIAGGAILDFISREIKRAPLWMRRIYLEWFYRLYLEPGRMWRRYIIGNIRFFFHIINMKLRNIDG